MRYHLSLGSCVLAIAGSWIAVPLTSQLQPTSGAIEARIGAGQPSDANIGMTGSLDVDLGYLFAPALRPTAGFSVLRADIDRSAADGSPVAGSVRFSGGRVGLRFDPLYGLGIAPYLAGTLGLHRASSDVDDTDTRRELDGTRFGGSLAAGAAFALDPRARASLTTEFRQTSLGSLSHRSLEAGIRIVPLGRQAYRREPTSVVSAEPPDAPVPTDTLPAAPEPPPGQEDSPDPELDPVDELPEPAEAPADEPAEPEGARDAAAEQPEDGDTPVRPDVDAEAARADEESEARRIAEMEAREAERRADEAEQRLSESLTEMERLIDNVAGIRESERGLEITLGDGLFGVGEHELSMRAREDVRRVAALLADRYEDHEISVEGHTDSTGTVAVNQRLSEQRAEAVRASLIDEGVDSARVDALGHGEDHPVADNATAEGRARNRRVEVVILDARLMD